MKRKINFVTIIVLTLVLIAGAIWFISHKNDIKLTVVNNEKEMPPHIVKWSKNQAASKDIQLFYEKQGESEYRYWLYLNKGKLEPTQLYETFKINAVEDDNMLKIYIEDALVRKDVVAQSKIVAYCKHAFPPEHVQVYYNKVLLGIDLKTI